jgi:hypothetical protein
LKTTTTIIDVMNRDEIVAEVKRQLAEGVDKNGEGSFTLKLADGKEFAVLSKGLSVEVAVGQKFPNSKGSDGMPLKIGRPRNKCKKRLRSLPEKHTKIGITVRL